MLLTINAGERDMDFVLPDRIGVKRWRRRLDTAIEGPAPPETGDAPSGERYAMKARSVALFGGTR